jgi:ribosome-interacting GTPase 1
MLTFKNNNSSGITLYDENDKQVMTVHAVTRLMHDLANGVQITIDKDATLKRAQHIIDAVAFYDDYIANYNKVEWNW